MGTYRINRVNEEIAKAVGEILRDVKEKAVRESVVTVTGASCAADLSVARVYYSYLGSAPRSEVARGLKNAAGYIRSRLARTLNLRETPELVFVYDTSVEQGAHIEKLLESIRAELSASDEAKDKPEENGKDET